MATARPLQTVTQPLKIPVPGSARISITGTTNAEYYQKVTLEDLGYGRTFVFCGQGEGRPMQIMGHQSNTATLEPMDNLNPLAYRTLSVTCKYSKTGRADDSSYHLEAVVKARTWAEYGEADKNTPIRIYWEIDTEDGVDEDFNDSVIVIVAEVGEN